MLQNFNYIINLSKFTPLVHVTKNEIFTRKSTKPKNKEERKESIKGEVVEKYKNEIIKRGSIERKKKKKNSHSTLEIAMRKRDETTFNFLGSKMRIR